MSNFYVAFQSASNERSLSGKVHQVRFKQPASMGGAFCFLPSISRLFSKKGKPKWMKKKGPTSKKETPLQGK